MSASFKKYKGHFMSANGISDIAYYVWQPEDKPRAAVQIVHGMGEYTERYEEFAGFLCENGIAVFGNDHIGHGASVFREEDKGYFFTSDGWKDMVPDCYTMFKIGKRRFRGVPTIVFGHSMGSFVTRAAITKFGTKMDCAILSGTGAGVPFTASQKVFADALKRAKGGRSRSELADKLAFGGYNSHIESPQTQSEWLTRDRERLLEYLTDPRRVQTFTINGYENLLKLYNYVSTDEWYESVDRTLPILIMSGDEDPVGGWGKGVREVYDKLKERGCNIALKIYEGARHELLQETNRDEVCRDVLRALEKTLGI